MDTSTITVDRLQARALFRKYREHQHYSTPIDWEIQRTYQLISQGRVVIKAIESICSAGLNDEKLPKLAIVRADAKTCFWIPRSNGGGDFRMDNRWPRSNGGGDFRMDNRWPRSNREHSSRAIRIPDGTWLDQTHGRMSYRAQTPLVPIHQRPKRGVQNYHILFEADWTLAPPIDPLLVRRIGQADLWVVLAAWDLGPIERAVLAGRITS